MNDIFDTSEEHLAVAETGEVKMSYNDWNSLRKSMKKAKKRIAKQEKAERERARQMVDAFDLRELRLIRDCNRYAGGDAAGLPGHNLILIINKMAGLLELYPWQLTSIISQKREEEADESNKPVETS